MPNVYYIKRMNHETEETVVEEFGRQQFPEAIYVYDSVLYDALGELSDALNDF